MRKLLVKLVVAVLIINLYGCAETVVKDRLEDHGYEVGGAKVKKKLIEF